MNASITNVKLLAALAFLVIATSAVPARASDAETSASATAGRGRTGTATATAHYDGDVGFARTDTRTGAVNAARAVAVGFDEDGLSLSISLALAPRRGPAYATNFNLTFDSDGDVSTSVGTSLARGGISRTVSAGGRTGTTPIRTVATSWAGGSTERGGVVRAYSRSLDDEHRGVRVRRVIRIR